MNCECRTSGDITHAGHLRLRAFLVALMQRLRREHTMLELRRIVPLRPRGDFEWAHFWNHVNGRQIESEGVQATANQCVFGSRKVTMPGLIHCSGKRNVEANLYDLVL